MFVRASMRRSLTLVALAVLALAAPGAAAAAQRTLQYGGSTSPQLDPLVITVRGSHVVRISRQYDSNCRAFADTTAVRAAVSRSGRFSITQQYSRTDEQGQVQTATENIRGRLTKSAGSGTSQITTTETDETGQPCGSGLQHWKVAHKPGRVFSGTTTQNMPVVMELSANRKTVNHLHVGWQAPCDAGGTYVFGDFLRNFPIVAGRFGDSWRAEFNRSDGGKNEVQETVSGTVGRRKATGSVKVSEQFVDATGATEATCTTPTVRWSARS